MLSKIAGASFLIALAFGYSRADQVRLLDEPAMALLQLLDTIDQAESTIDIGGFQTWTRRVLANIFRSQL